MGIQVFCFNVQSTFFPHQLWFICAWCTHFLWQILVSPKQRYVYISVNLVQFSWANVPTSIAFEPRRVHLCSASTVCGCRAGPWAVVTVLGHHSRWRRSTGYWSWVLSTLAHGKPDQRSATTYRRQERACFQTGRSLLSVFVFCSSTKRADLVAGKPLASSRSGWLSHFFGQGWIMLLP